MKNQEQTIVNLQAQLTAAKRDFETLTREYNLLLLENENLKTLNQKFKQIADLEKDTVFRIRIEDILSSLTNDEVDRELDEVEDAVLQEIIYNIEVLGWREMLHKEVTETLSNYRNQI